MERSFPLSRSEPHDAQSRFHEFSRPSGPHGQAAEAWPKARVTEAQPDAEPYDEPPDLSVERELDFERCTSGEFLGLRVSSQVRPR